MVAYSSNSSTSSGSSASNSRGKPHLTVRLVLELMSADCCASQRWGTAPDAALATLAAAVETHEESLRAALQRCLLAASRLHLNDSAGSGRRRMQAMSSASSSMSPAMSTTRHVSSCCDEQSIGSADSWDEEQEQQQWEDDCDYLREDRGRLGAAVRSRDLSLDDERLSALADHPEECCGGSSWESSAFSEVEDCQELTGVVAAIYGYKASGGDLVFLEKAYDLARGVAASKQDLSVAFNACRVALAVGYVYTFKSVSLDSARSFALHHSLPKLALSLKHYWSRGTTELNKQANELKWQECVLSLLEVGSSVSLLANEEDVFCALDADIRVGVVEAIGLYCVLNPRVLSQYQGVGRTCKERYLAILGFDQREQTKGKVLYSTSNSNNISAVTEQNWFVESE